MLQDPIVMNYGHSLAYSGGTTINMRRTAIGKYVATDGPFSSDQPARFNHNSNVRLSGPSSYKTIFEMDRNVAPINGVQQADDTCRVILTTSGNLRSFNALDLRNAINMACLYQGFYMDRLISGES